MQQETVLLDMDPYAVVTYNVMQSSIVINAVDSERTGTVSIFAMRSIVIMILMLMIESRIIFYILTLVYAIRSVQHNEYLFSYFREPKNCIRLSKTCRSTYNHIQNC